MGVSFKGGTVKYHSIGDNIIKTQKNSVTTMDILVYRGQAVV